MLGGGSISGAATYDIFASTECTADVDGVTLGSQGACAVPKADAFGIYAEGNASVTMAGGAIACMSEDGVSLRNNAALTVNAPSVEIQGVTISHCGCTGFYAEVGKGTAMGATLSHNHWGLIQHSALSSTAATASLFAVANENTFTCNTESEPGACFNAASTLGGADIWNDSGLVLDASEDVWDVVPVGACTCNSQSTGCTCTGWAAGSTSPPDGIEILLTPYSATSTGTPTVVTTGAFAQTPASGCL
jgi:hypothetical protein